MGLVAGCAPSQTVEQSREALWAQFGGQKLDALLVSWGAPDAETQLTDGARMVKYRRSTTYDAGSPYSRRTSCEVTFMAKPPKFLIDNVALEGNAADCRRLAEGKRGDVQLQAPPSPEIYHQPYGYYRIPY